MLLSFWRWVGWELMMGFIRRCAKRRDFCEYDNEPRKLEEMEVEEEEE